LRRPTSTRPAALGVGRGAPQDRGVVTGKTQRAQRRQERPLVRRQNRLGESSRLQRAHLGQSLQCRFARVGDESRVVCGCDVSRRQAGVIVRRAGDAVEIEFGHREFAVQRSAGASGTARTVSPSATPSVVAA
jgi:hypothetical protein